MDANNVVAAFAFGIGFIQMYQDYIRSDEMDEKSKNAILLSLLASCLWLIYQSRQYGMNFTVAYTTLGLILQVVPSQQDILVKENEKNEDKNL